MTNNLYRKFQNAHTRRVRDPFQRGDSNQSPVHIEPDAACLERSRRVRRAAKRQPAASISFGAQPGKPENRQLTPYFRRIYPQPLSIQEFAKTGPYQILLTLFDPRIYEQRDQKKNVACIDVNCPPFPKRENTKGTPEACPLPAIPQPCGS